MAAGTGTAYDLASDSIANMRTFSVADALCIERGLATTSYRDTRLTPPDGYYYLVRAANSCGPGPGQGWGFSSMASLRPACP